MPEADDWKKLELELVRLFKRDGAVGGDLGHTIYHAELQCGIQVTQTFVGYQILCDSFKAFCLETFRSLQVPPSRPYDYAIFVARISSLCKQLRASEILLLSGYPWQGYSLFRVIVEQVQIRLAVLQGLFDDQQVEGLIDGKMPETKKARIDEKKRVEGIIFKEISGTKSGLSAETISQFKNWDSLFDSEIHGLTFSNLEANEWLHGTGGLPIVPVYSVDGTTMYVNRYVEVAWMVHRLIPLLQLRPFSLSNDWAEKWQALDNSFMAFSKGLAGLGKPVALAIIELVTKKFAFDASSHFPAELKKSGEGGGV